MSRTDSSLKRIDRDGDTVNLGQIANRYLIVD